MSPTNARTDGPARDGVEFVLVPREPTPEMMKAFWRAHFAEAAYLPCDADAYRAMIAAAPRPLVDEGEKDLGRFGTPEGVPSRGSQSDREPSTVEERERFMRLAQAYDREDAAQRGEPSPWDGLSVNAEDVAWAEERIACAKAGFLSSGFSGQAQWLAQDREGRLVIQVEKELCGVLGIGWSATGISIASLVARIKERLAALESSHDGGALREAERSDANHPNPPSPDPVPEGVAGRLECKECDEADAMVAELENPEYSGALTHLRDWRQIEGLHSRAAALIRRLAGERDTARRLAAGARAVANGATRACTNWRKRTELAEARALKAEAERDGLRGAVGEGERTIKRLRRQMDTSRRFSLRDMKEALNGDLRAIRNRVALMEAGPVEVVLSEDAALPSTQGAK